MGLTVTAVADSNYLHHLDGLVNSMQQHNPEYKFFIRLIDCDESAVNKYSLLGASVLSDTCNFDKTKNLVKDGPSIASLLENMSLNKARSRILYSKYQCYCTHIRFTNVLQLLETTDDDVLVVDADTIVRGSLKKLEHLIREHDICTRCRESSEYGVEFDNEGFIGVRNCDESRQYWKLVVDRINEDLFNWDSDAEALRYAYNIMKGKITLRELSPKYKDDKLDSDSLVWSGSFSVKDTAVYKDELARYLTK